MYAQQHEPVFECLLN